VSAVEDSAFPDLMRKISDAAGLALDVYKDKCIRRRIAVRMRACGVHTYTDYIRVLDRTPAERERLRDALTINVTRFFRNPETWSRLERELIAGGWRGERPLRCWSAGCASGEEAYTLAIVAAEICRADGHPERLDAVHVDATDVDRLSLARARDASYRAEALVELPPHLRPRYFEAQGAELRLVERIRRRVTVLRRDLTREPPPGRGYHLIACRNVVIYFDRPMQERLFAQFADALAPGGLLVLGKVETLFGPARARLAPVDPRERIFRRTA
jgi:chemotaxis methyl-accepting protein methylase